LLRPGRLERAIEITRPDRAGALNILRYHLNGELLEDDLQSIAYLFEGSTGAEIMIGVRGARRFARYANRGLQRDDLIQSIAPIEDIAPTALNRICIHEAAHAVVSIIAARCRVITSRSRSSSAPRNCGRMYVGILVRQARTFLARA
jgi:hypothetical protein